MYAEQEDLKAALDNLDKETSTLSHTKTMLEQALEQWQAWNLETKQSFLKLCIERIDLEHVTPHILEITIALKEPIGGYAVGLMFRARPQKIVWSGEEQAILKKDYPGSDRLVVLQALPHRTWASIIEQAMSMGLTRSTYANSAKHIPKNLSLADYTYQQEGFAEAASHCIQRRRWDILESYQCWHKE